MLYDYGSHTALCNYYHYSFTLNVEKICNEKYHKSGNNLLDLLWLVLLICWCGNVLESFWWVFAWLVVYERPPVQQCSRTKLNFHIYCSILSDSFSQNSNKYIAQYKVKHHYATERMNVHGTLQSGIYHILI